MDAKVYKALQYKQLIVLELGMTWVDKAEGKVFAQTIGKKAFFWKLPRNHLSGESGAHLIQSNQQATHVYL